MPRASSAGPCRSGKITFAILSNQFPTHWPLGPPNSTYSCFHYFILFLLLCLVGACHVIGVKASLKVWGAIPPTLQLENDPQSFSLPRSSFCLAHGFLTWGDLTSTAVPPWVYFSLSWEGILLASTKNHLEQQCLQYCLCETLLHSILPNLYYV